MIIIFPYFSIYFSAFYKKYRIIPIVLIILSSMILASKINIYRYGDDIQHFINTFNNFDTFYNVLFISAGYSGSVDIIFWYTSYFISLMTSNALVFLFFWHISSLSILYIGYYKILKNNAVLAFIIFLSTTTFYYIYGNAIRQAFSVSLSVLSLSYLLNNNLRKSLLISFVSIFIHPTGIISFVMILGSKIRLFYIFLFLLVSFLLQFFPILNYLASLFLIIHLDFLHEKAVSYTQSLVSKSFISFGTFIFIFILGTYIYLKRKFSSFLIHDQIMKVYITIQSIYFIFLSTGTISDRIFSYRSVLDGVLIILFIKYFKQ